MRQQCVNAANQLKFAVACPTKVPAVNGHGMTCPSGPNPEPYPPCIGETTDGRFFFQDLSGFDVPRGYVGMGGKPFGHVIVAANRHRDIKPCFGDVIGVVPVGGLRATEYRCTDDSLLVERNAEHGEGAYLGHLLLAWTRDGIDYSVSAHGHTAVNLALAERLVKSVTMVQPTR
jgi:hypothetical protein